MARSRHSAAAMAAVRLERRQTGDSGRVSTATGPGRSALAWTGMRTCPAEPQPELPCKECTIRSPCELQGRQRKYSAVRRACLPMRALTHVNSDTWISRTGPRGWRRGRRGLQTRSQSHRYYRPLSSPVPVPPFQTLHSTPLPLPLPPQDPSSAGTGRNH